MTPQEPQKDCSARRASLALQRGQEVRYPFHDGVAGKGVQKEHCAEPAQQLGVLD